MTVDPSIDPARFFAVACHEHGTTSLPRAWDHLEVSLSILDVAVNGHEELPTGGHGICPWMVTRSAR